MARERGRKGSGAGEGGEEGPQEGRTETLRDELDRLLERFVAAKGPTLGRGDALGRLATANLAADRFDVRLAEDRYLVGEQLVEFAAKNGHHALGHATLGGCLRARFMLGRTWAYESMRLARCATRADIAGMSWTVASLGLELLGLLKVESLGELKKKDLPVLAVDGEPARFPAAPDVLEAAIAVLTRPPAKDAEPQDEETVRAVERAAERKAQAILDKHLAQSPELAEAKPTIFFRDGRAHVRVQSIELRSDTFAAVARLFADVEKGLRKG